MTVSMRGSTYCMSPVASRIMSVSEIVMRVTPPVTAADPMRAYVPCLRRCPWSDRPVQQVPHQPPEGSSAQQGRYEEPCGTAEPAVTQAMST